MTSHTDLTAHGNTYNPCLLILREKGYALSAEECGRGMIWRAEKKDCCLSASSPPELLGVAALWERYGAEWNRQQPEVLREVLDASSPD